MTRAGIAWTVRDFVSFPSPAFVPSKKLRLHCNPLTQTIKTHFPQTLLQTFQGKHSIRYLAFLQTVSPIPSSFKFPQKKKSKRSLLSAMNLLNLLFLFSILSPIAFANNKLDHHLLPRPLILEYPENLNIEGGGGEDDIVFRCTAWRFAVEANNVSPWKKIPFECLDYVKNYMMNKGYALDLEMAANEAGFFARNVELGGDGKDVWVFDVDETLLSNLPYYAQHGFGLEIFNTNLFDKWVDVARAPAIESSLKLYKEVLDLGFKVFLLTGRSEGQRAVTVDNLKNAGFENWDRLILRGQDDQGKTATIYKSERRSEMLKEGYRILGNSGDQWSDILGFSMSNRSFKLPNPMYHIP